MSSTAVLPPLPALLLGTVAHARMRPITHKFAYRQFQWLVDLDTEPTRGMPRAKDHLDGAASYSHLRERVVALAKQQGVDDVERVLMLAHAPVLGHVFDPMTAYWLLDRNGRWQALVLEVRNTYGGRHNYVLVPDESGAATTEKQFYVSPFNDTSGTYDVRARLSDTGARVTIRLSRDGETVFVGSVAGTLAPASRWARWRVHLRYPLMPQRVSALIRVHGIYLWLRRLPVQPRSTEAL